MSQGLTFEGNTAKENQCRNPGAVTAPLLITSSQKHADGGLFLLVKGPLTITTTPLMPAVCKSPSPYVFMDENMQKRAISFHTKLRKLASRSPVILL